MHLIPIRAIVQLTIAHYIMYSYMMCLSGRGGTHTIGSPTSIGCVVEIANTQTEVDEDFQAHAYYKYI